MTDLEAVIQRMEQLKDSSSTPVNIQELLQDSIEVLRNKEEELSVRVNTVSSFMDQISNDPNVKQHTRTEVWNISSMLESLEEE
ncbi:MAG: UPF0147 family protein [Candidatus Nanohaloarchaea archaeon]|nr:UPF0147 family protein [Candidatus Nanohaloarchaea archaeon]